MLVKHSSKGSPKGNLTLINLGQERRRILSEQLALEGGEDHEEVSELGNMEQGEEMSNMGRR